MAILCTNCGKELAQEGARFCSNCGVTVLADSSQSQLEGCSALLREQVAEQPFSPPVPAEPAPPSTSTAPLTSLPRTTIRLQSISLERVEEFGTPAVPAQQPVAVPSPPPSQPVRQPIIPSRPKASRTTAPIVIPTEVQRREEVEEFDTPAVPAQQPVAVPSPPPSQPVRQPIIPSRPKASRTTAPIVIPTEVQRREEVEELGTPAVPAQQPVAVPSPPPSQPVRQPIIPSRPKASRTTAPIVMPAGASPDWKRLRIIAALVCCPLVVGIVAWDILFQPFSVPAITHPQQRFSDSHLGISLLYPNGWNAVLDQRAATVRLYDSTNTAQITISITDAASKEIGQYLEQQAKQLGMTAIKSATVSFAGASWQQLQGSVQQAGADYTATMLATARGKHLFTIIQAAPRNTYQGEERVVFAPMRSSFSFSTYSK